MILIYCALVNSNRIYIYLINYRAPHNAEKMYRVVSM